MTEAQAWRRWHQARDPRSRDFLIEHYAYLVPRTVCRVKVSWHVEREDMLGVGRLALCLALDTFNKDKSAFATWASSKIIYDVQEACREADPVRRTYRDIQTKIAAACPALGSEASEEALAQATGLTLRQVRAARQMPARMHSTEEALVDDEGDTLADRAQASLTCTLPGLFDDPSMILMRNEATALLENAIYRLRPRTAHALREYYFGDETFQAIGLGYGVSYSRAYQIVKEGVERMKMMLVASDWIDVAPGWIDVPAGAETPAPKPTTLGTLTDTPRKAI